MNDMQQQDEPEKHEENKDTERKDQFEYIAAEIRRQHDVVTKIDESLDTKIGIILAFIFLVLSQIAFRPELTGLATKSFPLFVAFLCGFAAILLSIIMGIKGLFFVRSYDIGPRISNLIDGYRAGMDLNQLISKGISRAITYDIERGTSKATWLRRMLIAFIIGLGILIVLEILLYSSTLRL